VSGNLVYAGEDFTMIGANTPTPPIRHYLAALDATTGNATGWSPNPDDFINSVALDASGSAVSAGGLFASVGGVTRTFLAAMDAATGILTAWDPMPNRTVLSIAAPRAAPFISVGCSLR